MSPSSHQQPRNPNLDLDAAAAAAGAPASFFCPISLKIMRDPVTLSTGQSYDRPFIARWLAGGSATCPATGQALALPASQVPNVALRKATEDWAERHALWLLGPDGHVKPIPAGDDFSAAGVVRSNSNSGGGGGGIDEALRLQAEALERHQRGHREGGGGGGGGTQGSPPSAPPLQGIPCNGGGGGFGGGGGAPPSSSQQGGAFYPPYYPRPLPPLGHPSLPLRPLDHAQSACTLALSSPRLLSLALSLCSGATLALFGVSLWKNGWEVAPLRTNPLIGASPAVLLQLGAKDGASIVDGGQWWRLLSSAFACAGALDAAVVSSLGWTLGFRAVARSVVAPAVSVPLIYVSSSAFGALVSVNALPKQPTPSVGAPAGCAGLLGAAAALQLLHWRRFSRRLGTLVALVGVGGVLAALAVLPLNDCFYIGGGAAFGALSAPVLANSEGGGGGGGAAAAAAARRQRRRRNTNEGNANNSGEVVGGPPFSAAAFFSALFRLLILCSLAGALAAGVLGVTKYRAALGDRLCGDKCARAACVETRWWSCDSGVGGPGPAAPAPPAPPATGGATPACSATLEGDSTKVTCASTTKGASKGETKTLKGTRPTSGAGLIAVCREACLGGGGDPPAAAAPEKPVQKVTPVPPKDGVAADPSKGVLI